MNKYTEYSGLVGPYAYIAQLFGGSNTNARLFASLLSEKSGGTAKRSGET